MRLSIPTSPKRDRNGQARKQDHDVAARFAAKNSKFMLQGHPLQPATAQKRAGDLKAEFPMLQVKVYDAGKKKLLDLPPTE